MKQSKTLLWMVSAGFSKSYLTAGEWRCVSEASIITFQMFPIQSWKKQLHMKKKSKMLLSTKKTLYICMLLLRY